MMTVSLNNYTKLIKRVLKEKGFHCFIKPFTFFEGDQVNNLIKL